MLRSLCVENFALIHRLEIEFDAGFNILTGETGAGKSILIDAVQAVLGSRMSADCIRTGCDAAYIEAVFDFNAGLEGLFSQWGWEQDSDDPLIISRRITSQGKSQCTINGHTATLSMLRQAGEVLLDIHGQHDHQSLLRCDQHGELLDLFGGHALAQKKEEAARLYQIWRNLTKALQDCIGNERERAQRLDIVHFQLQEIAEAKLQEHEDVSLQEEWMVLAHAEKLKSAAENAYEYLSAGRKGEASVLDGLEHTIACLREIVKVDKQMEDVLSLTESALYQLQDASREVAVYKENIEDDPLRLQSIHNRLELIEKLKKKYGQTVAEIMQYQQVLDAELEQLANSEQNAERLRGEIERAYEQLTGALDRLSALREEAAVRLTTDLANELADLGMKQAIFNVRLERAEICANGQDRIEFMFSANPGEAPKPLAKIISGGEMSRVMLALKTVLANVDRIETVIFDEIDSGIGGGAAQAVAEKMAQIAVSRQVLCITHLPQIACMADRHFFIRKRVEGERTYTEVVPLDAAGRKKELARMLGGEKATDITLRHAGEMLNLAEKQKKIWKK